MATYFGTKIAINAYKCICMKDSENVITYNRGFSWSTNPPCKGTCTDVIRIQTQNDFCCFPSVTFEPLHYLLNFIEFFTLIFSSSSSVLLGWPNGWMDQVTTSLLGWLGNLVVGALDLQLDGRDEFNSRPQRCRVTTLGKLFTPYASVGRSGITDCGVRGRGQLCLSQQPLRYYRLEIQAVHPYCSA